MPAAKQERASVDMLCKAEQRATYGNAKLSYTDQERAGQEFTEAADDQSIDL